MKQMMTPRKDWRKIETKFFECLRDDRGVAMTEYLLVTCVTLPLVFILFHPDNGFYKAARDQYNLTTLLLVLPCP